VFPFCPHSLRSKSWYTSVLAACFLLANSVNVRPQKKILLIAVEDDAAPWSRADGTGYANDVVTAAFKAAGVDVSLRVMPYARCKRMVTNGDLAGCLSMSPAPEFKGVIELSARPLFTCYAGYFYKVDNPPKAKREQDLPRGTVVGTVIGYEYPPSFEALRQNGAIVVEESPSEDVNLRKLAAGRIDLALLTYNEVKTPNWLIEKAGVGGKVKVGFPSGVLNSYVGFSAKNPEGATALAQFNKGYHQITVNGTLRNLKLTWLQKLAH
jgi:ABC-type amino acid transport substrate-binding protein